MISQGNWPGSNPQEGQENVTQGPRDRQSESSADGRGTAPQRRTIRDTVGCVLFGTNAYPTASWGRSFAVELLGGVARERGSRSEQPQFTRDLGEPLLGREPTQEINEGCN